MQIVLPEDLRVQRSSLELRELLFRVCGESEGGRVLHSDFAAAEVPQEHGVPEQLVLPRGMSGVPVTR